MLGILRNLLVYGFDKSGESTDSQAFFDLAVSHLREFYQICELLLLMNLTVDNTVQSDLSRKEILRHIAKLTKLFLAYASERPFEFLIMNNAPMVTSMFVQICQHEAGQFDKPSEETDETGLAILSKIVIGGISTVRSLLRGVSDPRILDKGIFLFGIN